MTIMVTAKTTFQKAWHSWQSATTPGLLVTDGRVNCPRAQLGGEDVDRCYSCPALRTVDVQDDGSQTIHCRPALATSINMPAAR
jgi:hypothetical protein